MARDRSSAYASQMKAVRECLAGLDRAGRRRSELGDSSPRANLAVAKAVAELAKLVSRDRAADLAGFSREAVNDACRRARSAVVPNEGG